MERHILTDRVKLDTWSECAIRHAYFNKVMNRKEIVQYLMEEPYNCTEAQAKRWMKEYL